MTRSFFSVMLILSACAPDQQVVRSETIVLEVQASEALSIDPTPNGPDRPDVQFSMGSPFDDGRVTAGPNEQVDMPGFSVRAFERNKGLTRVKLPLFAGRDGVWTRTARWADFIESCWLVQADADIKVSEDWLPKQGEFEGAFDFRLTRDGVDMLTLPVEDDMALVPRCQMSGASQASFEFAYELPHVDGMVEGVGIERFDVENVNGLPLFAERSVHVPSQSPNCAPIGFGGQAELPPHHQVSVNAYPSWGQGPAPLVMHGDTQTGRVQFGPSTTLFPLKGCGTLVVDGIEVDILTLNYDRPLPTPNGSVRVTLGNPGQIILDTVLTGNPPWRVNLSNQVRLSGPDHEGLMVSVNDIHPGPDGSPDRFLEQPGGFLVRICALWTDSQGNGYPEWAQLPDLLSSGSNSCFVGVLSYD